MAGESRVQESKQPYGGDLNVPCLKQGKCIRRSSAAAVRPPRAARTKDWTFGDECGTENVPVSLEATVSRMVWVRNSFPMGEAYTEQSGSSFEGSLSPGTVSFVEKSAPPAELSLECGR